MDSAKKTGNMKELEEGLLTGVYVTTTISTKPVLEKKRPKRRADSIGGRFLKHFLKNLRHLRTTKQSFVECDSSRPVQRRDTFHQTQERKPRIVSLTQADQTIIRIMLNLVKILLICLIIAVAVAFTAQYRVYSGAIERINNGNQSTLDQQQIVLPVKKINLAMYNLMHLLDGGSRSQTQRKEVVKSVPPSGERLREVEWEFDERPSTRRIRPSSTTTTTTSTTTTTTTRRPYRVTYPSIKPRIGCFPPSYRFCQSEPANKTIKARVKQSSVEARGDACYYNEKRYQIGEQIAVPDKPCSVCTCRQDWRRPHSTTIRAKVDCSVVVECPELAFGVRPRRNQCYFAYTHDRCCGEEICTDELLANDKRKQECRYRLRTYRYGEYIHLTDDRCRKCICNEHWNEANPASTEACVPIACPMDPRVPKSCEPIISPDSCCPLDYVCLPEVSKTKENSLKERGMCFIGGKAYPRNKTIHVTREFTFYKRICATCQCTNDAEWTCETNFKCEVANGMESL